MEKINSKDLFDFITDQGPLPENFARGMFSEIVQTVIQCRDSGVLHRDIKDENILVDMKTQTKYLRSFAVLVSTVLLSGSWRGNTRRTSSRCGPWESSCTTCCVETSPSPQTTRSAGLAWSGPPTCLSPWPPGT